MCLPLSQAPNRHRGSVSSKFTAPHRTDTNTSVNSGGKGSILEDEWEENVIAHPVQPRAVIPMLPPVLVSTQQPTMMGSVSTNTMAPQTHVVDSHPACWLAFTEDAVITSCKSGKIPSHANLDRFSIY